MSTPEDRRNFLVQGAAVTAGLLATGTALGQQRKNPDDPGDHAAHSGGHQNGPYPRMQAGLGGPIGSPTDRGKLVPGLRKAGLPPVGVTTPDLQKLSGKIVNGAREFHVRATPVRRELLPGIWMDALFSTLHFRLAPCPSVPQIRLHSVARRKLRHHPRRHHPRA